MNQVILYGSNGENWNDEFVAFSDVRDYIESPVNKAESISDDDDIYRIANDTYTDINLETASTFSISLSWLKKSSVIHSLYV